MPSIGVYTLRAFAAAPEGGNPAGVVLGADGLSEGQMLRVAKRVGFPETAFVQGSDKADFRLRFFTPSAEVPLCGHATVAAFRLLAETGAIGAGEYRQETKAGVLGIELLRDGSVFMDQTLPLYLELVDQGAIAESLRIDPREILGGLPIQAVSTGLKDIMVPLIGLDALMRMSPDLDLVRRISEAHGAVGYHIFTLETRYGSTAHCRNLAPLYGIDEEAATGTSNGALACYLHEHGALDRRDSGSLSFEQGYSLGRPSAIRARLDLEGGEIRRVLVGGTASGIRRIEIEI